MKKFFTMFFALLAFAFCAKAQVPVFSENFDSGMPAGWTQIDANNDGMGWEHSSNPASYFVAGTDLSGTGHNSSNGFVLSGSYSNVTNTAITPDNWLITPTITLTSNSDLSFYVCAQDASYAAEHYGVYITTGNGTTTSEFTLLFEETIDANGGSRVQGTWGHKTYSLASYTGQTVRIAFRHFNCNDMFVLNLDDVEVLAQPTGPTIIAQPTTIDFGSTILGTTKTQTVNVTTYNLTSGVTATTAAPFEVSADGTTFGTTATVASTGGSLYVQYAPTAVGTDNGTVTLASTGATDVTIAVSGSGMECNATVPYSYSFTDETANQCWEVINANNDDYTFEFSPEEGYASIRWNSSLDADDWLISPYFALTGSELGSFDYRGGSSTYIEKFQVFAIGADTVTLTPVIQTVGSAFQTQYLDLSSLTGNYRIAIHCISDADQLRLYIANFTVNVAGVASLSVDPEAIDFGVVAANGERVEMIDITTISVTTPITISVAAPFEVSLDNTTYAATATIPASPATVSLYTVYVKFAPTTTGTFSQNLIIATTDVTDTVALVGEAIDCTTSLPYSTNFDNAGSNICWDIVDANNDGYTFIFNTEDGFAYYPYNTSNPGDDWLISPVFTLTGEQFCFLDYAAYSASFPERFQVFAIDANNNQVALTGVIDVTSTTSQTQTIDLTSLTGNYRIGIHCISDANMWYLIITNFNVNNDVPAATMTLSTDALDFGVVPMGSVSNPQVVVMNTINVNEAFTLSAPAPYQISLDGNTYAASQTIPANPAMVVNDTIYVRFAPSYAGTYNQNLTINSTTYNSIVSLIGSSVDCSNGISTFPFVEEFNDGVYPPVCWGYNDAANYDVATVDEETGDFAMYAMAPDMLVTPEITSTSPMALMFDYRNYLGGNYDEDPTSFRVGYSTTNDDASSFTWFTPIVINDYPEDDELFYTYTADIPANAKYIAIDFTEFGYYYSGYYEDVVFIDNFRLITDGYMAVSPETINFGSVIAGTTSDIATVNVTAALLSNSISITAPANFEVSTNGSTFAATATMPQNGGNLFVRYNPSGAGSHNGTITLTSGSISKTIAVSGSAIDCSQAQALPYFDGFEDGISACYRNIDNDGDGYTWYDNIYSEWPFEPYEGNGCAMSASYINDVGALYPDNWLITPALAIPAQGAKVSWYVAAQDGSYPAEYYEVLVSSTPDNLNSYATIFNETLETSEWEQRTANIPSSFNGQTAYVAFRHYDVTDMFWMKIDNLSVTAGTGIENHEVNATIYPNPANNVLNISATENINRVEVYNMMGQLVGTYDANDVNTQINTTRFANGVYTVKIETENGTSTQKFTVAR